MSTWTRFAFAVLIASSLSACKLAETVDSDPKGPQTPPPVVVPPVETYACFAPQGVVNNASGEASLRARLADLLLPSEAPDHVVTGVSVDIVSSNVVGLALVSSPMDMETGVISISSVVTSQVGTLGANTLSIDAPAGFYVYGVGLAPSNTGVKGFGIKIYVARPDLDTGTFETMECIATLADSGCETTPIAFSGSVLPRYKEYLGTSNAPLRTIGFKVSGNTTQTIETQASPMSLSECSE
jgi:hypothetical protein